MDSGFTGKKNIQPDLTLAVKTHVMVVSKNHQERESAMPRHWLEQKCWWFWVNYNELTTTSLEIIVSKGNHPQMALIQVSELL